MSFISDSPSDVASPFYRHVTKFTLLTETLDWCPEALLIIVQSYVGTETQWCSAREWGKKGNSAGSLINPFGIVVRAHRVYVTDHANHRIQVFHKYTGEFIEIVGSHGSGPLQFDYPHGIALDGDTLFVTEQGNHRLQSVDLKRAQHIANTAPGVLYHPKGMCVSGSNVFLVDAKHRVCVFDKVTLRFLRQWGEQGQRDGQLYYPFGVAVVGDKVFVVDSGNHRIQIFRVDGTFLKTYKVEKGGSLNWPSDVAVVQGEMFIADKNNHRIVVLSSETGELMKCWGYKGTESGRLQMPSALAFSEGALYIAEQRNHRIQVVV